MSVASNWGLAGPDPTGWADWELRLAGTGVGTQVSSGLPGEVQGLWAPPPPTMHMGGPALPCPPGGQPCRNLRGHRTPTASSLLRGSAQICRLEKPTPAYPALSPGRGPALGPQTLPGVQSFPRCSPGLGRPVRASSPGLQAQGEPSPAPSSQPSTRGVGYLLQALGSRRPYSSTRSTPSCSTLGLAP